MIKVSICNIFDLAKKIADERHDQKKTYKTHLKLSENYELVGVLGEMIFSLIIQDKMDTELRAGGDDGFDFKTINVKTSEEHKARHLIEFIDKKFDGYYVFVIINLEEMYGYVKGYIHSSEFKAIAEEIDFGYGRRLAITLDHLRPYTPKNPLVLNDIYNGQ